MAFRSDGVKPISSLILKIAGNCNLDCSYCYWFKQPDVRSTYRNMSEGVVNQFLVRFAHHIRKYELKRFHISLHGGEPLLFPKKRFRALCEALLRIGRESGCDVELSLNTNGTLIDDEWCCIFAEFIHNVGVSIDGPQEAHDSHRVDLQGRGTFNKVIQGVRFLEKHHIKFGVLSVSNHKTKPKELLSLLVTELKLKSFDVLIPDATYINPPEASISEFYIELFDLYTESLVYQGVKIRILNEWARTCLGIQSRTQSVGNGCVRTVMIKHDGRIEPLDVLHNLGDAYKPGRLNVFENELNDITADPFWNLVYTESAKIPEECRGCRHEFSCGGGNIVERWSSEREFANKSIYCADLMRIYDHISNFLNKQLA